MRDVRVIILAGGHGTRLRPFTSTLPKAAVLAINRPAISYAMDLVCRSGITDVGILYAEDILRDIAEQLWGRRLTLHWLRDDERTGTGSALRAVPPAWRDGEIVILPGDIANDSATDSPATRPDSATSSLTSPHAYLPPCSTGPHPTRTVMPSRQLSARRGGGHDALLPAHH